MKSLSRLLLLFLFGYGAVCAQTSTYVIDPSDCEKPAYPSASKRLTEEGTVQLKFLVGVDGKVIESVVEKSSGFRRLDEAARDALSKCTFKPSVKDGQIVQSWTSMKYTWRLEVFAPCVGSDASKWRSCLGTLKTPTGGLSVVEYEAGKKNGRGIEYDAAGNVIRAGIFEGEKLVSERILDLKLYPFNAQLTANSANQPINSAVIQPDISSSTLPACQGSDISRWSNCVGSTTFNDGNRYVGEFKDGKLSGQGTYTFSTGSTGDIYVGEFKDGKLNGRGTLTFKNGKKYIGEYKDGKMSGQGTLYSSSGAIDQEGLWADDKFVRSVTAQQASEPKQDKLPPCTGNFIQSDWSKCQGKIDWGTYTYTGEFSKNRPHGRGEKRNPDGVLIVDGIWHEGELRKDLTAEVKLQVQQATATSAQPSTSDKDRLAADVEAERKKRQELEQQLTAAKERERITLELDLERKKRQELEAQLAASVQPPPTQTNAPRRTAHALVIGNAAYPGAGRLGNPVNDANAISQKLRSMGFIVTTVTDANRQRLVQSMAQFRRTAASADISLLYYAGHGVQIFGTNYILPTDVDQTDPAQATIQGVSLNSVVENFLPGKTKLVFLDACRDNALQRTNDRSVSKGLAPISAAEGTLISYATKDGQTAADGVGSKNSPFTQALLEHLNDPQDIAVVLRKVRERVMKITGGKQQPWEYGSLTGGELVLSAIKPK